MKEYTHQRLAAGHRPHGTQGRTEDLGVSKRPVEAGQDIWHYLRRWPTTRPEKRLGIDPGLLPQVWNRYRSGFRIERLAPTPAHDATEMRIPCQRGEFYPVSEGWWAWCGTPGKTYRRLLIAAGPEATSPGGTGLHATVKKIDEVVIWFPDSRFEDVARIVRARRRNRNWSGMKLDDAA